MWIGSIDSILPIDSIDSILPIGSIGGAKLGICALPWTHLHLKILAVVFRLHPLFLRLEGEPDIKDVPPWC